MLEAEAYKRGHVPDEERPFAMAVAWPRVLELYAGSGALAIEALSRGAEVAHMVEPYAEARRTIGENLRRTSLQQRAQVHPLTAEQALERVPGEFDLVLMDPPYADSGSVTVLRRLAGSSLVHTDSVIVLEHPCNFQPPAQLDDFLPMRTRRHGTTCVTIFGRTTQSESNAGTTDFD